MPEICTAQRTAEWLQARVGRVTASVAAACLNLDRGKSARAAWREILGQKTYAEAHEYESNRHMQWGVQFEASARLDYEVETGNLVQETGFWTHPLCDWLGASPDGLVGTGGLVEVKCPMERRDAVPIHHKIQCLVQLAVTGRTWCDYWSWPAPPQRPFLARIFRQGIPGLISRLKAFYDTFVTTGVEPGRKKARRRRKAAESA